MRRATFSAVFIFCVIISFISGCVENPEATRYQVALENSAQLLQYIESTEDFANSEAAPGFVTAAELNANRAGYIVADIRDSAEYAGGHIAGAIPIAHTALYSFCDSLRAAGYTGKLALACRDGHASAYYVSLLRSAEIRFAYCLKYGMASWNSFFASHWLQAINLNADLVASFVNTNYDKNPFSPLPPVQFSGNGLSVEQQCRARIRELIARGFNKNAEYVLDLPVVAGGGAYIVCYGKSFLYLGPRGSSGHPAGTRLYLDYPSFDFRSTNYLQTLPAGEPVTVYSSNGLLGACMVAHFRLLGYDAKALLYGANQLFHDRLLSIDALRDDAFGTKDIMNFPFVTGNGE